jgi:hypothetical protein
MTTVTIDLYQTDVAGPGLKIPPPQRWRWRARNAGNNKILAQSSEAYTNRQDCLDTITALFGPDTTVYLRQTNPDTTIPALKTLRQPPTAT